MDFSPPIQIPPPLQPYISRVWYAEGAAENAFPIFADGRTGLIFQQSGMILGNTQKVLSQSFVFGQTLDPIILHTNPNCRVLGLIFHPHVLPSIFRLHAKELTDECVDISLLPAVPRVSLNEQLWNTVSPQRQFEILFSYLEKMITPVDPGMEYATNLILTAKGKTSLKDLHYHLNLTERTFERRFEQYVGISARLFSNIAQFQSAISMLDRGQFSKLSDIAYANGYADQSHFIRWFKKFTGVTPLEHCRNHSILKTDIV
ncbi:AraC family transcriptional regulator [Chitinophaga sp. sic0106]|uniref:helix-turn-helix domain-containing protein n=1 Tax=Chitinophaga sp. sic0106 TaxID=2854785 RepID=UPI001C47028C|nr:response regulator transcription factor [Chitinophaga sp. sic0106]MBV7533716.1 helix-turn-helix transcriptional regulator [Chitinophaga sp. sic0106]